MFHNHIFSSLFALIVVHKDLSNVRLTLKYAHALFSAAKKRTAKFSAQEWESWLNAISKACSICFADFFCNYSQIVDDANVFQIPDAVKVVDALLQSAQHLLFDASSDVDVDQVMKCFNIREHRFIVLQRVKRFVAEQSHVDLLLKAYRSARGLLSSNEDGLLIMMRVMDFCAHISNQSQCYCSKLAENPFYSSHFQAQALSGLENCFLPSSSTTG